MKLSRKLQRVLIFLVIASTTTLLLISVVPLTLAQNRIPAPEIFPEPTTRPGPEPLPRPTTNPVEQPVERVTPAGECFPVASSRSSWLLPVPSNNPPVAKDDRYRNRVNIQQITINALANDSDPNCDRLTITSVTQGHYGSVASNPDGTITYTATTPAFDSFTYTISDGKGGTATATVTVTMY